MGKESDSLFALLVMLNNYVHDLASGFLLVAALWLWWTSGDLGSQPAAEALLVFKKGYRRCVVAIAVAVAVIVVTGAVRTAFFRAHEWSPALEKGLVRVLVVKHLLLFGALGAGVYAWIRLRARLRLLPGWIEKDT